MRNHLFLAGALLTAVMAASGCASTPSVKETPLTGSESGSMGVLYFDYQVIPIKPLNKPFNNSCTLTLEDVDGNQYYDLAISSKTLQAASGVSFDLPAGKYVFRDMSCDGAFRAKDLQAHYPYVVHIIGKKISYLGKIIFQPLESGSDYAVKNAGTLEVSRLLEKEFKSQPSNVRSRLISAYTTARIPTEAYLGTKKSKSRDANCPLDLETCLDDEMDRNPLIVGSLRFRRKPGESGELQVVEDSSTYTDLFRQCVTDEAGKARDKLAGAGRCEVRF